jgi:hypothetical protein
MSAVPLFASDDVRWAQVGKLIKKIVVRPDVISRHLPVGENSEEDIRNVVDEPPPAFLPPVNTRPCVPRRARR